MDLQFLQDLDWISLLQIILIDIVLSADNALVIALATKNLPKQYQNRAILFGVAGAVVLRVLFASGVVFLLKLPMIYFLGGILLIFIGYKLIKKEEESVDGIPSHSSLFKAITTIVTADVIMSLDNVVAIAGAAKGNLSLLIFGVAISIPIMIFGAKFIVILLNKYAFLLYAGAGILVYTGVEMMVKEKWLMDLLELEGKGIVIIVSIIITAGIIVNGWIQNQKVANQ